MGEKIKTNHVHKSKLTGLCEHSHTVTRTCACKKQKQASIGVTKLHLSLERGHLCEAEKEKKQTETQIRMFSFKRRISHKKKTLINHKIQNIIIIIDFLETNIPKKNH